MHDAVYPVPLALLQMPPQQIFWFNIQ